MKTKSLFFVAALSVFSLTSYADTAPKITSYKIQDTFTSTDPKRPGVLIFAYIEDSAGDMRNTLFWSSEKEKPSRPMDVTDLVEIRLNYDALNGPNPQLKASFDGSYNIGNTSTNSEYRTFSGGVLKIDHEGLPFDLTIKPGANDSEIEIFNHKIGALTSFKRAELGDSATKIEFRNWLFGKQGNEFTSAFSWNLEGQDLERIKISYYQARSLEIFLSSVPSQNIATYSIDSSDMSEFERSFQSRLPIFTRPRGQKTGSPQLLVFDSRNEVKVIPAEPTPVTKTHPISNAKIVYLEYKDPYTGGTLLVEQAALDKILSNDTKKEFRAVGTATVYHSIANLEGAVSSLDSILIAPKKFSGDRQKERRLNITSVRNSWADSTLRGLPPPPQLKVNSFSTFLSQFRVKFCAEFYKPPVEY